MITITEEQLNLFLSLFRGRLDVYARRWEKNGKSGYSPAYSFNWVEFMEFKNNGGNLKSFANKKFIPLTPDIIKKHLFGGDTVGIYPILPDNTSFFIAADFDGENWFKNGKEFINECEKISLNSYIERSRSGNGCHVWIFFETPYPCWKSRKVILEIIKKILKFSDFDKEISFDRLFPNQDNLTKDGFGNLIALPFQGRKVVEGNTIFIDPKTNRPISDQWDFVSKVKKHNTVELDNIYNELFEKSKNLVKNEPAIKTGSINIILNNKLLLKHSQIPFSAINFLKENLNFFNSEYLIRRRLGKSVFGVEKYFKLIEESNDDVLIPKGFLTKLTSFLDENKISYSIDDQRPNLKNIKFASNITLRTEQCYAVEEALKHDSGVIVAPSGSGKTIIGLEIIAKRKLPALILVHRQQLLDQWIERIESFLGIPKTQIGQYTGRKKKIGKQITVAMMQTLNRMNLAELKDSFGTIITDECHHIPAKTFREVASQLNPKYNYGLTATTKRKHNDEQLIYMFIGEIIASIKGISNYSLTQSGVPIKTDIFINETDLSLPFKFSTDNFQLLSKIICFDNYRNQLLIKGILEQIGRNKKVLVLSERRDHLEVLKLYLKGLCEVIVISGEDSASKRHIKIKQIEAGHYQVILSTGQFFGEGLDIQNIDCLIIAFPFSFEGKLIQYIGRLRGHNNERTIIDYRDKNISFLERQFKQRQRYYKKIATKQQL
ncbi:MAG: hypothetical protein A2998_01060 [Candidatus Staskawiczbacteria bacterium RIFCSPLOWO2_01_FULL_37_25b]|uniref:Restriction endonuclease subunit R n=2 Tax=Candidatus Staskawicziibacteriota TaxID=1817916 RepID=A0A1G2IAJ9_9BACT|nr:MAG: hypothetical protein A2998_01060 [Candidatus Staskawiczbacteria bacterium RIFCSPLOWO2_01_FULL_37_25b]